MGVPFAKSELHRIFPGSDVDVMVEAQPWLLIEDIANAVSELRRYGAASHIENAISV